MKANHKAEIQNGQKTKKGKKKCGYEENILRDMEDRNETRKQNEIPLSIFFIVVQLNFKQQIRI